MLPPLTCLVASYQERPIVEIRTGLATPLGTQDSLERLSIAPAEKRLSSQFGLQIDPRCQKMESSLAPPDAKGPHRQEAFYGHHLL